MEKEKLVHYVPADMLNRLKKLLVRLWETRNPASAHLSAILNDVEPEVRSLNDTIVDISSRERDTAIREKEKNWARERENLRDEAERGLEELRASAAARLEKAKVSFACEKAELSEAIGRAQREIETLASENRKMSERVAGQENELKRRLFEARSEFERESLRRVQAAVEEVNGRLLASLNAAEKKKDESLSEAAHAKEECSGLKDALAEKARQFRERCEWQAAEAAEKEKYLASAHEKVKELEKKLAALKAAHEEEKGEQEEARERLKAQLGEKYAELEAGLKARFENEKRSWEAERERIKVREGEGRAELEAVLGAKEKSWAVEKERYESELSLCDVSTRSFISEQTRKVKEDLAKWKEELEEEYKARLAEQLRAKDVLLISEKGRLAQEFLEKYAAMEARLRALKVEEAPKAKKKRGA